ncbi:N-acetylneuraminate lyase-like [Belonocnema kinseyi]|uniref:N-acetylneuraminate lyase-like n=1 Tax=Belonocnema kinseyi TaxID=2817044 RepID=UPI00143DD087|nr:N-acetylneuraminate lyase-like [Belonocnema kinseyi]
MNLDPQWILTDNTNKQLLNLSVIPEYAKYLAEGEVKAVLVAGTTGEEPALSVKERKKPTEVWAEAVKTTKQHVRVQIGGAPFPDVLELAGHAEKIKVGSILLLSELFFKPFDEKELISYLKAVSDVAPNTPLLYYHTPKQTNIYIHMGQFFENVGN